jgi:uncharacterized protein (TIGR02996 family)
MKEQLEAEIFANPEAQDAYLAYADFLAAEGDPRGEMIGIGRELAKNPGHKAMLKRHAELEPQILGPLAEAMDLVTNVAWFMGFIKTARVAYTHERFNGPKPRQANVADVLALLLAGPGRFLQDLTIGIVKHDAPSYGEVAAVIGRAPRVLRRLFIGDFEMEASELNWRTWRARATDDLSPIWPMCQALREVTLRAGTIDCGPISLPKCVSFSTITGGLDAVSLGHIVRADWPELVELSLQIGIAGDADLNNRAILAPLFDAAHVPKLKKLALKNTRQGDAVLAALAESKLLAQLEELDVSMSTVEDEGFEILEEHRDRFKHLKITLGGEETEPREIPDLTITWEERYGPVYE